MDKPPRMTDSPALHLANAALDLLNGLPWEKQRDPKNRAAEIFAEMGDSERSLALLEENYRQANEIPDSDSKQLRLGLIANSFIKSGDILGDPRMFGRGMDVLVGMPVSTGKVISMCSLFDGGYAFREAGFASRLQRALLSVLNSVDPRARLIEHVIWTESVAIALAQGGAKPEDISEILEAEHNLIRLAGSVEVVFIDRIAEGYAAAARYLGQKGFADRAMAILTKIKGKPSRVTVLSDAAIAYARLKLRRETQKCLEGQEKESRAVTGDFDKREAERRCAAAVTISGLALDDPSLAELGYQLTETHAYKINILFTVLDMLLLLVRQENDVRFLDKVDACVERLHCEKKIYRLADRVRLLWKAGRQTDCRKLIGIAQAECLNEPEQKAGQYLEIAGALLQIPPAEALAMPYTLPAKMEYATEPKNADAPNGLEKIWGETRKCPNCGEEIPSAAAGCPKCKAEFEAVWKGYCSTEGAVVEAGQNGLCSKCGKQVLDLHVESRMTKAPPPAADPAEKAPAAAKSEAPAADAPLGKKPQPLQTKKCPLCAEEIKAEAKICRFCGAQFEMTAVGYCSHCHRIVHPDSKDKCPECGGELMDRRVESKFTGTRIELPNQSGVPREDRAGPGASTEPLPSSSPAQSVEARIGPKPSAADFQGMIAEAMGIIETKAVQYTPGIGLIKVGGTDSAAMHAAELLGRAFASRREDAFLHYAYASALHLAMQYKTGREEMERLAQAHPDFLLARFALDGWEKWDGLFLLPPWEPEIQSVHPAVSAEVKRGYVLATRQGLQPRATLFLRDAAGDFSDPAVLHSARIDITTVLSDTNPPLAIVYAKIWDNPSSPYHVEALGVPIYPHGHEQRCKYEYLCLQQDIDFAVIDNRDKILVNRRLPMPPRMKAMNAQLLRLLKSNPGREIANAEIVNAARSHQSCSSLNDIRY